MRVKGQREQLALHANTLVHTQHTVPTQNYNRTRSDDANPLSVNSHILDAHAHQHFVMDVE